MQRTLLLSLASLLAFGCGDDDDGGTPDAGMFDAATDTPAPPGAEPASIEVSVSPPRAVYRTEQSIRMLAEVRDVDDLVITDAQVTWSADPASAATDMGDGVFELVEEGYVEFTGCTVELGPDGSPLCDFGRILVDSGAPNLEVISPTPGAELGADGSSAIEVIGSVADTRDVRVFVNGVQAELDDMGAFTANVPALFGINHIEVVASDGVTEDSRVEMDVLWADVYSPAANGDTPQVMLDDALILQLGQDFFDDGTPLDTAAMPIRTTDLADVFELVIRNVDFRGFLPDPVVDSAPTLTLRITEARIDDVDVITEVVDGGVELFVRIGALDLDTAGNLDFEGTMLDLGGGMTAAVSAFAHVDVSKDGPDSPIESSVSELSVAIEDIEGRFTAPEANAILRLAEGLLRSTIEAELESAFGDSVLDAIPAVLTDALGALDSALRDQSFPIETDIFAPVTLNIDGRLAGLDSEYRRHMRAPLQMTVSTDSTVQFPDSRGAADLIPMANPLFETTPVQLGVKVSLLNGLTHALWNSGLLNVDASTLLPESVEGLVMNAQLVGRLPPVARPARGAETDDLVLVIGQAELTLEALGATTVFGMTIEAGTTLNVTDGAITLDVAEEPFIRTWIISSTDASPPIDEETLRTLLLTQLWPELRDSVVGGLAISLPSLDVGDLSSLAPGLSGFALNIELADRLDVREDSIVLDLNLVGSLP